MCINASLAGEPFDKATMLPNIRPSHDKQLKEKIINMIKVQGLVDYADEKIYQAAKAHFYRQRNVTL